LIKKKSIHYQYNKLMASNRKNKNFSFKEGSNPLFPISNQNINLINYYSALKLNNKMDLKKQKKKIMSNTNINSNSQNKRMIDNSPALNTSKIKIKALDFSTSANDTKIYEKIIKENMNKKQPNLSANKSNINLENKNNINFISPKNIFEKSQILNINNINNKNNIFSVRNPNIFKNVVEINNSNNKSYINNIIINNSSTNINQNILNKKPKNSNNNSKININNIDINNPKEKETNIKLVFKNNNIGTGKKYKLDNLDIPITLKRKDSPLPFTYTSPNNLKEKNIFNGNYKLHLKKQRNISDLNDILNMNNVNNFMKQELKLNSNSKKKKKVTGPEDLHFYFINAIQDGKKNEMEFKD